MKGQAGSPGTNVGISGVGAKSDASREPAQFSSRDLFDGKREVIIAHGQERYRLCVTASNKLILIK